MCLNAAHTDTFALSVLQRTLRNSTGEGKHAVKLLGPLPPPAEDCDICFTERKLNKNLRKLPTRG